MFNISQFQCPDCSAGLESFDKCESCGRIFDLDEGLPVLTPTRYTTATFQIQSNQLDPLQVPIDSFFKYPKNFGQAKNGPYHLDRAHEDVLTNLGELSRMLEVGCGGAQMRNWAKIHSINYLGVDISTTRVGEDLQAHGGPDILCDAHSLPIKDESIDVVYSIATLEHLAFPHVAVKEVARTLKPGGYYLGTVSFLEPWHDSSYFHMSPLGVYMVLALSGLEPTHVWPSSSWSAFNAILAMGNKATYPISSLGRIMNAYFLAPKILQFLVRKRRVPKTQDLINAHGCVSGAMTWIARKPLHSLAKPLT